MNIITTGYGIQFDTLQGVDDVIDLPKPNISRVLTRNTTFTLVMSQGDHDHFSFEYEDIVLIDGVVPVSMDAVRAALLAAIAVIPVSLGSVKIEDITLPAQKVRVDTPAILVVGDWAMHTHDKVLDGRMVTLLANTTGLATQVTLAAILVDTTAIVGSTAAIVISTASIDTKTPALGTAAMVGSSPVTIASNDTLTVAANILLATIAQWDDTFNHAEMVGAIADDAIDVPAQNKPVKVGGVADDVPTLVADGDMVQFIFDLYRKVKIAGYDDISDSLKNTPLHDLSDMDTTPEDLATIASGDLDNAWADFGSVIDMRNRTQLNIFLNISVIGNATNIRIKALGQTTFAGGAADEYNFSIETPSASDVKIEPEYVELNVDGVQLLIIKFKTEGIPYIQMQMMNDVLNSTAEGTIKLNKMWR